MSRYFPTENNSNVTEQLNNSVDIGFIWDIALNRLYVHICPPEISAGRPIYH